MVKYLCSLLARCFNAHLDEEEKKIKALAAEMREYADEFNRILKAINAKANISYRVTRHGKSEIIFGYAPITDITVYLTRNQEV